MNHSCPQDYESEYPEICPHRFGHEQGAFAVVIASGPCRDKDVAAFGELVDLTSADIIGVNGAGVAMSCQMRHWVSIHGDQLLKMLERRRSRRLPDPDVLVGTFHGQPRPPDGAVYWRVDPHGGSSSLLAVRWALTWGYRRIVLCGCPLTGTETLDDDGVPQPSRTGTDYAKFREGWIGQPGSRLPLAETVRSMSGWTRETFGAPSADWLRC